MASISCVNISTFTRIWELVLPVQAQMENDHELEQTPRELIGAFEAYFST